MRVPIESPAKSEISGDENSGDGHNNQISPHGDAHVFVRREP
jgi:hypothetical protein